MNNFETIKEDSTYEMDTSISSSACSSNRFKDEVEKDAIPNEDVLVEADIIFKELYEDLEKKKEFEALNNLIPDINEEEKINKNIQNVGKNLLRTFENEIEIFKEKNQNIFCYDKIIKEQRKLGGSITGSMIKLADLNKNGRTIDEIYDSLNQEKFDEVDFFKKYKTAFKNPLMLDVKSEQNIYKYLSLNQKNFKLSCYDWLEDNAFQVWRENNKNMQQMVDKTKMSQLFDINTQLAHDIEKNPQLNYLMTALFKCIRANQNCSLILEEICKRRRHEIQNKKFNLEDKHIFDNIRFNDRIQNLLRKNTDPNGKKFLDDYEKYISENKENEKQNKLEKKLYMHLLEEEGIKYFNDMLNKNIISIKEPQVQNITEADIHERTVDNLNYIIDNYLKSERKKIMEQHNINFNKPLKKPRKEPTNFAEKIRCPKCNSLLSSTSLKYNKHVCRADKANGRKKTTIQCVFCKKVMEKSYYDRSHKKACAAGEVCIYCLTTVPKNKMAGHLKKFKCNTKFEETNTVAKPSKMYNCQYCKKRLHFSNQKCFRHLVKCIPFKFYLWNPVKLKKLKYNYTLENYKLHFGEKHKNRVWLQKTNFLKKLEDDKFKNIPDIKIIPDEQPKKKEVIFYRQKMPKNIKNELPKNFEFYNEKNDLVVAYKNKKLLLYYHDFENNAWEVILNEEEQLRHELTKFSQSFFKDNILNNLKIYLVKQEELLEKIKEQKEILKRHENNKKQNKIVITESYVLELKKDIITEYEKKMESQKKKEYEEFLKKFECLEIIDDSDHKLFMKKKNILEFLKMGLAAYQLTLEIKYNIQKIKKKQKDLAERIIDIEKAQLSVSDKKLNWCLENLILSCSQKISNLEQHYKNLNSNSVIESALCIIKNMPTSQKISDVVKFIEETYTVTSKKLKIFNNTLKLKRNASILLEAQKNHKVINFEEVSQINNNNISSNNEINIHKMQIDFEECKFDIEKIVCYEPPVKEYQHRIFENLMNVITEKGLTYTQFNRNENYAAILKVKKKDKNLGETLPCIANAYKCYQNLIKENILPPVEIKLTENKGYGVFAIMDIPINTLITEYCGELKIHELIADSTHDGLFTLIPNQNLSKELIIDPSRFSNLGYFLNAISRCRLTGKIINGEAKLKNIEARREKIKGKYHLFYYSLKNIYKGEELLLDYQKDYWMTLK